MVDFRLTQRALIARLVIGIASGTLLAHWFVCWPLVEQQRESLSADQWAGIYGALVGCIVGFVARRKASPKAKSIIESSVWVAIGAMVATLSFLLIYGALCVFLPGTFIPGVSLLWRVLGMSFILTLGIVVWFEAIAPPTALAAAATMCLLDVLSSMRHRRIMT